MEALWACLTCSQRPSLRINSQSYSIVRLLDEGGYAYVYLVVQGGSDKLFALKKIRCMFGGESVANAMHEVEAGNVFKFSDHISNLVDSAVVQEDDGTKTVYIIMPYYSKGSLQDLITDKVMSNEYFAEKDVVKYALGMARAIEVLHTYRSRVPVRSNELSEDEAGHLLSNTPEEGGSVSMGDLLPYAHRDIKPANVMLGTDSSNAVLIDLGFCSPARVHASSRKEAVQLQDLAAEHCTLPFRAPELFDVRTGSTIDEKVDIWAFGCTLFNLMYLTSPFEREEQVSGANVKISVLGGKFSFPEEPLYSTDLRGLISMCLQVKPAERPAIETVIEKLEQLSN